MQIIVSPVSSGVNNGDNFLLEATPDTTVAELVQRIADHVHKYVMPAAATRVQWLPRASTH
jgi:hypothetical protein